MAPDAYREGPDPGMPRYSWGPREEYHGFLSVVETFLLVVAYLAVAVAAAGSLTGEREGDTWISLVTTDLTGRLKAGQH